MGIQVLVARFQDGKKPDLPLGEYNFLSVYSTREEEYYFVCNQFESTDIYLATTKMLITPMISHF